MRRPWTTLLLAALTALVALVALAGPAAAQEATDEVDAGPPGERPDVAGEDEALYEAVPEASPPWFGLGMGLLSVAVGVLLFVLLWKQRGDRAP